MFDKLIEFVISILHLFRFWTVAEVGSVVVIYTLGMPTRVAHPGGGWFGTGFFLKAPFNIETDRDTSVLEEILTFAAQDLTTRDGHKVRVAGAFTFSIAEDKAITWQTTLGEESIAQSSAFRAAIAEAVINRTLVELMNPDELKGLRQDVLDCARKQLNRYGYRITEFKWVERVEARVLRAITGD